MLHGSKRPSVAWLVVLGLCCWTSLGSRQEPPPSLPEGWRIDEGMLTIDGAEGRILLGHERGAPVFRLRDSDGGEIALTTRDGKEQVTLTGSSEENVNSSKISLAAGDVPRADFFFAGRQRISLRVVGMWGAGPVLEMHPWDRKEKPLVLSLMFDGLPSLQMPGKNSSMTLGMGEGHEPTITIEHPDGSSKQLP